MAGESGRGSRRSRALPCDRRGRWLLVNDAHVEIDSKTGKTAPVLMVFNAGTVVHPSTLPGQEWGGASQVRGTDHKKERRMASLFT